MLSRVRDGEAEPPIELAAEGSNVRIVVEPSGDALVVFDTGGELLESGLVTAGSIVARRIRDGTAGPARVLAGGEKRLRGLALSPSQHWLVAWDGDSQGVLVFDRHDQLTGSWLREHRDRERILLTTHNANHGFVVFWLQSTPTTRQLVANPFSVSGERGSLLPMGEFPHFSHLQVDRFGRPVMRYPGAVGEAKVRARVFDPNFQQVNDLALVPWLNLGGGGPGAVPSPFRSEALAVLDGETYLLSGRDELSGSVVSLISDPTEPRPPWTLLADSSTGVHFADPGPVSQEENGWSRLLVSSIETTHQGTWRRLVRTLRRACAPHELCLQNGAIRVALQTEDPRIEVESERVVSATALPLSDETGAFWVFRDSNVEAMVKVVDGSALNGQWWLFVASLSTLPLELSVLDTETGLHRDVTLPGGALSSYSDTSLLPVSTTHQARQPAPSPTLTIGTSEVRACSGLPAHFSSAICLGDRFEVDVDFVDPPHRSARGRARPVTR